MAQRLVRISKTKGREDIPLKTPTLYKWWHTRKHPELFVKLGSALFVDLDRLDTLIEAGRGRAQ